MGKVGNTPKRAEDRKGFNWVDSKEYRELDHYDIFDVSLAYH